jgi:class 3 adenylate cyclase
MYSYQSDYPKSLTNYLKALSLFEELEDIYGIATIQASIGSIYSDEKNYNKAIEYYKKSLFAAKSINNKTIMGNSFLGLANLHTAQEDNKKGLEYYKKCLALQEEVGDYFNQSIVKVNIGHIYLEQKDYIKAMKYYQDAMVIFFQWRYWVAIANGYFSIGALYFDLSQDSVSINPNELNGFVDLNKEINLKRAISNLEDAYYLYEEIGKKHSMSNALFYLSKAYSQKGNYKKAYEAHVEHKKLQDSVFNMDKAKEIATLTATREKEVAEKELEIQKLENIRRRNESYALYGGMALFAFVLFVIYRQRKRSEKLLLNILPAAIAKRLKAKEHPIADHFEEASVVFIDIVGFTKISSDVKAERIVEALNIIFTKFDEIAAKYKLEKIKTIGDSYMAVTGVPLPDSEHAKNMAKFALEVKTEMHNYRTEDNTLIQFRLGIDCGEVIAGVIGSNKFIYDLWGDTVNTASRMESNGSPDEIHVTESFRDTLADSFLFEERGEIAIKGKGTMKTYYLTGEKNA